MSLYCAYCGDECPHGVQWQTWECCGEVGHVTDVDPMAEPEYTLADYRAGRLDDVEREHGKSQDERARLRGYAGFLGAFK